MGDLGVNLASGIKDVLVPSFLEASTVAFLSPEFRIAVGGLFLASFVAFIMFGSSSGGSVDLPSVSINPKRAETAHKERKIKKSKNTKK